MAEHIASQSEEHGVRLPNGKEVFSEYHLPGLGGQSKKLDLTTVEGQQAYRETYVKYMSRQGVEINPEEVTFLLRTRTVTYSDSIPLAARNASSDAESDFLDAQL